MNSRHILTATSILVLSLLVLLLASATFSHHHRYRAQDSGVQNYHPTPGMPKTFVSSHWALPSGEGFIRYYIDASTMANVTPHPSAVATPSIFQIHEAVSDWESVENGALSSLEWREADSPGRADVIVRFDRCFGGQLGHFFVQAPHGGDGWHNDVTREARYWEEADLCIDGSNEWHSADAILSMISHEFGHAYGLHEGYRDLPGTGGCGPNDTIMDTIDDRFSTSTHEHCDGITEPNYTDVRAVKQFLLDGKHSDTTYEVADNTAATSTATITWKDTAWGEHLHEIMIKYTTEEVTDPDRVEFAAMDVAQTYHWYQRVGHHQNMPGSNTTPLTFPTEVDLTAHHVEGNVLPTETAYVVCVTPFFRAGGPGDADCSDPIWVDNSEHNEGIPPTGALRLAPGQPTRIRYGQTLSLVASELSHDTSAYKLRLYHPFAPEDADCDTYFQNATGYLDLFYNDVDLPGQNITVRGCGAGSNRIQLLSGDDGDILSQTRFLQADSSPQNLVAEATDNSIRLTWTPSPDPAFASQYVQRYDGRQFTVGPADSSAEDTSVTPNTTYTYHIKAVRDDGYSLRSNTSTVTFRPSPETPTPTPTRTAVRPTDTPTPTPTIVRPTDTPAPTPTIVRPTDTPTPTYEATATQAPLLQPPTITGISRSGRTLTVTYVKASDNDQILFYLYRTSSTGHISQKYDAISPVTFSATRGHYYYVRGKSCETGIRSNTNCGELSTPSDTIYVPHQSNPTPTKTPTPVPPAPDTPTPTRTPYPPTATPELCPDHTPNPPPHCVNSEP